MAATGSKSVSMKSRQSCVFGKIVHSTHNSELFFVFRELKVPYQSVTFDVTSE